MTQEIIGGIAGPPGELRATARTVGELASWSATTDAEGGDDVGRIDMVLVSGKPVQGAPMEWCALEIQAVYFSGNAMRRRIQGICG